MPRLRYQYAQDELPRLQADDAEDGGWAQTCQRPTIASAVGVALLFISSLAWGAPDELPQIGVTDEDWAPTVTVTETHPALLFVSHGESGTAAPPIVEEDGWIPPLPSLSGPAALGLYLDEELGTPPVAIVDESADWAVPVLVRETRPSLFFTSHGDTPGSAPAGSIMGDDDLWPFPAPVIPAAKRFAFYAEDEVVTTVTPLTVDESYWFNPTPSVEPVVVLRWSVGGNELVAKLDHEAWPVPVPARPKPVLTVFWDNDEIPTPAVPLGVADEYWQVFTPDRPRPILTVALDATELYASGLPVGGGSSYFYTRKRRR